MATILLRISSRANQRLLFRHLARDHSIVSELPQEPAARPVDLAIFDTAALTRGGAEVIAYKAAQQPLLMPLLLVIPPGGSDQVGDNLWAHVEDSILAPVQKKTLDRRVRNLLRLRFYTELQHRKLTSLERFNEILEERLKSRTTELRDSFIESVVILTRAAEYKDEDTAEHISRMSYYTKLVAEHLGMDAQFQDEMFYASPMHDIGKLGVPEEILLKPGPLTEAEWVVMKNHPVYGAEILAAGTSPYARMGREIALTHHERWDGTGYPRGLRGEQIPVAGRIMNLCDVYDALRSERPYKPALDHKTTVDILLYGDGRTSPTYFDPTILAAFKRRTDEFADIFAASQGVSDDGGRVMQTGHRVRTRKARRRAPGNDTWPAVPPIRKTRDG